jgi:hypothetical protein
MHSSEQSIPVKTTEVDDDTVLITILNKFALHDHSKVRDRLCYRIFRRLTPTPKTSHPTDSSVRETKSITVGAKFADNICDVLVDKTGDIPSHGVLDDGSPGLAYQVTMLQDRVRLGQHLLSGLRAELEQEKLVRMFYFENLLRS